MVGLVGSNRPGSKKRASNSITDGAGSGAKSLKYVARRCPNARKPRTGISGYLKVLTLCSLVQALHFVPDRH